MKKLLPAFLLHFLILYFAFGIHEYGHLRELQKQGIPVEEFSLGIGPRLFKCSTDTFVISVRLLPFMAYVKPTPEGFKSFEECSSVERKFVVLSAGIRNNFLACLGPILMLQILGFRKGYLTHHELIRTMALTPLKILLRPFTLFIGCISLGKLNLTERCLLSIGKISVPDQVRLFIFLNLALFAINILPFPGLDGGKMLKYFLISQEGELQFWDIPRWVNASLLIAFFMTVNKQDWRIFEEEPKKD